MTLKFTKHYGLLLILLFSSCATYQAKYADVSGTKDLDSTEKPIHSFYLIGDAGKSPIGDLNPVLKQFKKRLSLAEKESTAIFLGDNIYPAGLPDKDRFPEKYALAKNHLDAQLSTVEDFEGRTVFIPGNHDWYSKGLKGLKRQEKYIEDALDNKNVFLPENGCPIKEVEINDQILVVAIDTEWYLTNWDKHPTINDDCEIKTREKFFEELESIIKKNAQKTTILALHHPMFSYGSHGGQYALRQHLYPTSSKVPLPVLGTLINVFRKASGASTEDLQSKRYRELQKRIVTLAQFSNKVIFASGHEHTLQYIVEENTPQIVSGSGAKKGATRLLNGSKFSTGRMGYAILQIYSDGSSRIRFYGTTENNGEEFLFTAQVLPPDREITVSKYDDHFPPYVNASVYTEEETSKSGFYKWLWGDRYRNYYSTQVRVPTVNLDALFGGLKPVRKGGGHQSKSLRLRHKNGKEYVMRALRKSAELYLQSMAFKDQYVVGDFENTYTEAILSDFYTGSHPYAPFTVGPMADALDIYHTNPVLYYVPKQSALEEFNTLFGDELYMIEEHVSDGHENLSSFGFASKIESTDDLLKKLRKDEKYVLDETSYVRARLFDMMLGDWDRHVDQWRWAEFEDKASGKIIFKPIPRDRDQVFSIMGDGALMNLATRIIPGLRLMEGFNEEIRSVRGFNSSPKTFVLDKALLSETGLDVWEQQARFIQENLTPEDIDLALAIFPEEVRDSTVDQIKKILLERKSNLVTTAREYHAIINKFGVVFGTDKDDYFTINRYENDVTQVIGQRIKDGDKADVFYQNDFDREITKEIWIYGLDDKDVFEVNGNNNLRVRIIGGQNNDVYRVRSGNKVTLYDHRSKKNDFTQVVNTKIRRTNNYKTNTYIFENIKDNTNQFTPLMGANPDDGLKLGFTNVYTYNGFNQNPFTQQHTFNAAFYFATNGFDLSYKGEFANLFPKWNLELAAAFTSPNFSINFFGFGNDTPNFDDDLDLDFNRVKIQQLSFHPSLVWRGQLGAKFRTGVSYESIDVEETEGRFISTFFDSTGEENTKDFIGIDAAYTYENTDNTAFPTLGMASSLHIGYKANAKQTDQNFGYIIPSLSLDYKLVPNGRLVLATKWKAHFNLGNGFEFYQGASIGANDGLRGFRYQRFTGKTAYFQNTDIRFSFGRKKTGLLPLSTGIFGGFDYGRVWLPDLPSETWHTSYGGGFFLNGADIISANLAVFNSTDGIRFAFGIGFGF